MASIEPTVTELNRLSAEVNRLMQQSSGWDFAKITKLGNDYVSVISTLEGRLVKEKVSLNPLATGRIAAWTEHRDDRLKLVEEINAFLLEHQQPLVAIPASVDFGASNPPSSVVNQPDRSITGEANTASSAAAPDNGSREVTTASVASNALERRIPTNVKGLTDVARSEADKLENAVGEFQKRRAEKMDEIQKARADRLARRVQRILFDIAKISSNANQLLEDDDSADGEALRDAVAELQTEADAAEVVIASYLKHPTEVPSFPSREGSAGSFELVVTGGPNREEESPNQPSTTTSSKSGALAVFDPPSFLLHQKRLTETAVAKEALEGIPRFSGGYESFIMWEQAAKEYASLDFVRDYVRFTNLKKTLTGDAAKVVAHLTSLHPGAIKALFDALRSEYGDQFAVITAQKRRLGKLQRPRAEYLSLRDFVAQLQDIISTLEAYGYEASKSIDFYQELVGHLPENLHRRFVERSLPRNASSVVEFLRQQMNVQRNIEADQSLVRDKSKPSNEKQNQQNKSSGSKNFNAVKPESQSLIDTPCRFCSARDHNLPSCAKFAELSSDDRLAFVFKQGLHVRCMTLHKSPADCPVPAAEKACPVDSKCRYQHHRLLHGAKAPPGCGKNTRKEKPSDENVGARVHTQINAAKVGNNTLRVVKVHVRSKTGGTPVAVTMMIDNGSTQTFVKETLASRLGLKLHLKDDWITTLHGTKAEPMAAVDFQVSSDGISWYDVDDARTSRCIEISGPLVRWSEYIKGKKVFDGVKVDDVDYKDIQLLLGNPQEHLFLPTSTDYRSDENGVLAYPTRLGWTIAGPMKLARSSVFYNFRLFPDEKEEDPDDVEISLVEEFRRFNDIDAIGILKTDAVLSRQEERDQQDLNRNTEHVDRRLTVSMLWKGEFSHLPNSELQANRRLRFLQRRLEKNPALAQAYADGIDSDEKKGYIRRLGHDEARELRRKPHWFLPHFVVCHPDKPDRPRRVLDCAAVNNGVSLNALLRSGPNNLTSLLGILLRFRAGRYAINADITEMFSQIRVAAKDAPFLAFLWAKTEGEEPAVYVNDRHVFGAKCSPAIANHAVREAVNRVSPDLAPLAQRQIYMDDFYWSSGDRKRLVENSLRLAASLKESGFSLRKWTSNEDEIIRQFAVEDVAPGFRPLLDKGQYGLPTAKALGVTWDCARDELTFANRHLDQDVSTVAEVLSVLASLYDPLLIVGPYSMRGKLIMQKIRIDHEGWKTRISDEYQNLWREWMDGCRRVATLRIPRWYGFDDGCPVTLHVFSDASDSGYGAVSYLVSDQSQTAFIAAKGRVINPLKPPSTPRGELQGLLLGTRLAETVTSELRDVIPITKLFLWTDSAVVYFWYRNDTARYQPFVSNRLREIHELVEGKLAGLKPEVRHVPTDLNPADLISRGCDVEDFMARFQFWITGPDFLRSPPSEWPIQPKTVDRPEDIEVRRHLVMNTVVSAEQPDPELDQFERVIDYVKNKKENPTVDQVAEEERNLVRTAQQEVFSAAFQALEGLSPREPKLFRQGLLRKKDVFRDDDGLLRLVTRLTKAEFLGYDEKYPVILPPRHPVTDLIIRDRHQSANHGGVKDTLAAVGRRYFVIHGPSAVLKARRRCQPCLNRQPRNVGNPIGPLHENRLCAHGHVFEETGMDHFGPFHIKRRKVWGLMFMCLTTRAFHLEPVSGLAIGDFMGGLERFIARRGKPRRIRSDNGTSFVGASKEFERLNRELCDELPQQVRDSWLIDFTFNPPHTPHWGGSWERGVHEIKKNLKASCDSVGNLTFDAFSTFLARAEGILNRRPIAFDDEGRAICPAQILAPATEAGFGFPNGSSIQVILRQVKQAEDFFWRRWKENYLRFQSVDRLCNSAKVIQLKAGDRVLLRGDYGSSNKFLGQCWTPATVVTPYPSPDGAVRSTLIRTDDGKETTVSTDKLSFAELEIVNRPTRRESVPPPSAQDVDGKSTL